MKSYADGHNTKDSELASKLTYLNSLGEEVSGNAERRLKWLEIIKAINAGVPRTNYPDGKVPTPRSFLTHREKIFTSPQRTPSITKICRTGGRTR